MRSPPMWRNPKQLERARSVTVSRQGERPFSPWTCGLPHPAAPAAGSFQLTQTGSDTMHRLLVLYNEPKDPAHFRKYYVETHVPLASKMPGVKSAHYSFDVKALGPG